MQTEIPNLYFINGLKARSSKTYDIDVILSEPDEFPNLYKNYNGALETIVEFPEFAASAKHQNRLLVFENKKEFDKIE